MSRRRTGLRQRAAQLVRVLLYVACGAVALYYVAINVFVRTRIFRNLIGADPDSLLVDYTSAYSIVPGRIHVEGLRIRGKDSNVEWILSLDRCDFDVSFRELAHKKFHASHVEGDGLSLRMRQREPTFTPDETRSLPPVPGFSDPPYSGVKPPPLTDANYNLWTIQLDGVHAAHVREIWLDTMRYAGDVDIRGRWYFRPVRWLDVGPATIDARVLQVSRGIDEIWAWGGSGHLVVTVHPFDVRVPTGLDVLHQVSVSGDLRGALRLEALSERALAGRARVTRGDVFVDGVLDVDHGVVRPPTHVHAGSFEGGLHAEGLDFAAALEGDAAVDPDGTGHARVDARAVKVAQSGFARGTLGHADAVVRTRRLDLAALGGDATYTADVEDAATDSLRYWWGRAGLETKLPLDAREATATAHLEGALAAKSARGWAHAAVRDAVVEQKGVRLRAASLKADVERFDLERAQHTVRAGLAHASAEDVSLETSSGRRVLDVPRVNARAEGMLAAPAGVLGHVALDVPSIRVPDASAALRLVKLPSLRFEGGAAAGSAKLDVDLGQGTATGSAALVARGLRVHAGDRTLDGDATATLLARSTGQYTALRGSSVVFRERASDGWWAKAWLEDGWLSFGGGPRFRGKVVVHAKDASPLEAMVAPRLAGVESLALGAVPTGDLDASGELLVSRSAVEAREVWARSDGFDMGLELVNLGPRKEGALLVEVGLVHAGVDLSSGQGGVILFGAGPWFAAKSASVREVARRFE
ncbi:MAG TPA: hypothetical protein VGG39_05390 [Polyangiaceae bacterium]|jgi:hypothetical protein